MEPSATISLTTPALLFPAISLLLLAYTNRFLTLANLMRDLYSRYKAEPSEKLKGQINNLKYRIVIIRNMQVTGVSSFFMSALTMFSLFVGQVMVAQWMFGASLLLLLVSLALSLREVQVSIDALNLQVSDID
jgi:hypothetical protein